MATVEAGGLVFEAEPRTLGDDGAPALLVFGDVNGKPLQLLRFDCFRQAPHFHYDPTGRNELNPITDSSDPVAWTMEQVRSRLNEMVRTAGYSEVADKTDMDAVSAAADGIETALRSQ